jgi:hypothetical protein
VIPFGFCLLTYSPARSGDAPPDPVCLSYTHDDDYEDYLELAPEKRAKRDASRRGG